MHGSYKENEKSCHKICQKNAVDVSTSYKASRLNLTRVFLIFELLYLRYLWTDRDETNAAETDFWFSL